MSLVALILTELTAELALFAAVGFLLFAIDDLAVDLIYFVRRSWRALAIYSRFPKMSANALPTPMRPGWMAVLIPAWDEASVIAPMLRSTLARFDHGEYWLFVGHYRNDPATQAAIDSVRDPRVIAVEIDVDGPTTKADCLNRLYAALVAYEKAVGRTAKAIVLHDAEDPVHPLELKLFDRLVEYAGLVQLPVVPLIDPDSRWVGGHYADEFAEAHMKELVVREAVGAAIPLAGVGCAIERVALSRLASRHDGRPFAGSSMTEDYEMGLRLGAIGVKTMFVRIPAEPGSRAVVASRGHFPSTINAAVRQKARWIGGIAFAGWDQLGWRGGPGERWMRMRDRRGPLAALLLLAGYSAAVLWAEVALAAALGAPIAVPVSTPLATLMWINGWLLGWRMLMRASFTTAAYGWKEGLRSLPRMVVANVVAVLAARRALMLHSAGGARQWDKTHHIFPAEIPRP
ncbi:glycosyl transferase family protein [Sphingomonas sp.]|uniref:glycosyl transferase family protein n=1 Tax=Sphingomonas sp. TaxID=28214 RepID=UPI0025CE3C2A|nr:glycosyl transferase family protein [Sphingomonas sp.]